MNAQEKLEHRRRLGRERTARNYKLHGEAQRLKKKNDRADLKKFRGEANQAEHIQAPTPTPTPPTPTPTPPTPPPQPSPQPSPTPKTKIIYNLETILGLLDNSDMNAKTRLKYKRDITLVFRITQCDDLGSCLKTFNKIKTSIENAKQTADPTKGYAINTIKGYVQSILFVIDTFKIPILDSIKKKYNNWFDVLKIESSEQTKYRKTSPEHAVIPFDEYLTKIKSKFGEFSKQNLIANLYNEATVRDNFSGLEILPTERKNDDSITNFIIVPRSKNTNCRLIINSYKTQKKYGQMVVELSPYLSSLIRKYIANNYLTTNLFNSNKQGLTSFVSTMNKNIGVSGGISTLRQMKISQLLSSHNLTPEQRVSMANSMGHSPITQLEYRRLLQ